MAYTRGSETNIIVGAAALFTYADPDTGDYLVDSVLPDAEAATSYKDTLSNTAAVTAGFRNIGFTSNGLELQFQPDFGEVKVDQMLDVAKLYKQGMQVSLKTSFAEATLENLLFSLAGKTSDKQTLNATGTTNWYDGWGAGFAGDTALNLSSGDIGECPIERSLVAVGPGTGDCTPTDQIERIYVAYRALSIENVSVSAKRDEATMFDVTFRLLPVGTTGSYGKIIDHTIPATIS